MSLKECREKLDQPLRQVTLCFLVRKGEVLLAMKKRGFGKERWNGVGGKPAEGETIQQAVVREAQEEIGVTPTSIRQVATIDFYFPHHPDWSQQVHVFLADIWRGEPVESEEMTPRWFKIDDVPYGSMWSDDIYWLPKVLSGRTIEAECLFDKDDNVLEFNISDES